MSTIVLNSDTAWFICAISRLHGRVCTACSPTRAATHAKNAAPIDMVDHDSSCFSHAVPAPSAPSTCPSKLHSMPHRSVSAAASPPLKPCMSVAMTTTTPEVSQIEQPHRTHTTLTGRNTRPCSLTRNLAPRRSHPGHITLIPHSS